VAEPRLRQVAPAVAVTLGLVALDVALGDKAQISGSYMLGAFVAAILGGVRVTFAVALLALVLAVASPLWDHGLAGADYGVKVGIVVFGDLFALEIARLRERAMRSLREQSVLAALAELPMPGATPDQTVARITELLVPEVVHFAAIDARRGDDVVRVGSRGDEPGDPDALFTTELHARGRVVGALTIAAGPYSERDRRFVHVLAGRVALVLDNAGLTQELETVEQRLDAILANLAEAVTVQDRSGRLVFANQAAADLLGAAGVEELLTSDPNELIKRFETFNEDGSPLRSEQLPGRRVLAGEPAEPFVVRVVDRATGEARWRMTKATPVFGADGEVALAVNIIEDVTASKRAELGQRLLADASAVLGASLDYESTLQQIAELAVPRLADWCSVSVRRGPLLQALAVAHSDPAKVEWGRRYSERFPIRLDEPGGIAEVFRTGQAQLVPEVTTAMLDAAGLDPEQRRLIGELGMTSVMLVPMATPERTVGVITMTSAESGHRFTDDDLELAEELGRRAGTALENARLHTELGEVARTLQRSLLPPRLPEVPGWSLRSLYVPATGQAEVGGDFYDVFPTAAGWMAVIGDVAGRGAAAASLTAMARYTLRTAGSLVGTPAMGLARLNENLRARGELALCTAAIVLLRDDAEASVVSAGHPLPLLVRDGRAQLVGRTGPLLGAFDHGHWLPAPVTLEPGDVLVLFTDGVLDARGRNGDGRFGEERLAATLAGATDADDAIRRIRSALEDFSGGEHTDDTAVLALMRAN
jgi:PAS domain S-box-containing protein